MPTEFRTIKGYGLHAKAGSFAHMKKFTPANSELSNFLKRFATEDVFHRVWETPEAIAGDGFWRFAQDVTSSQFQAPATPALGGSLVGGTGITSGGAVSLRGQPIFKGSTRAFFHVHFKLSAVTSVQYEIGFIDAVTDPTLPCCTSVDTPTSGNGAADLAVVHMDTSATLTTSAFVVDGSTSGQNCVKSNLGTFAPTADTYVCVRVFIDGTDATCIVNNNRATYTKTKLNNIKASTLIMPWVFARTKTTTNRDISVDFLEVMGERVA